MAHIPLSVETFLLSGYILFSIFLNVLALLISTFYQKKFNQPAPKIGFISAIVLATAFIILLYIPMNNTLIFQVSTAVSLFGSGVASIYSILYLLLTMSKVRK